MKTEMNWIPTSEELPVFIKGKHYSENVLAWFDDRLMVLCYCKIKEEGQWFYVWANCHGNIEGEGEWDDNYCPTHWTYLPSKPDGTKTLSSTPDEMEKATKSLDGIDKGSIRLEWEGKRVETSGIKIVKQE